MKNALFAASGNAVGGGVSATTRTNSFIQSKTVKFGAGGAADADYSNMESRLTKKGGIPPLSITSEGVKGESGC